MRFAKFGFKPSHLKRGINIITLKVTSGAIVQIPRDNWRNYSRSYISSNNGISWERVKEELDRVIKNYLNLREGRNCCYCFNLSV